VDLSCIRCHKNGVLVAIGDSSGKAHVLKMNNSLASVGKNERVQMTAVSRVKHDKQGDGCQFNFRFTVARTRNQTRETSRNKTTGNQSEKQIADYCAEYNK